ncbi:immunoglobulin-like domain-containing protein [Enterococcus sp. LJL51]|uniref:immunoglobulin-like domain-containing protein n=1 Tax=Enterococcus sp. LJL51 TaxID=3416656 RepID=UPI003CF7B351
MKTNVMKIAMAVGLLTFAGGTTFAEIYDKSADEQKKHTQVSTDAATDQTSSKTADSIAEAKPIDTKAELKAKKEAESSSNTGADFVPPVVTANAVTVSVGQLVNIYEGVTAYDDYDGDLSAAVGAEGNLDTSKAGTQTIRFSVADSSGNIGWADKTFTITAPESVQQPAVVTAPAASTSQQNTEGNDSASAYQPMTIYINGQAIPYQNGGQGSGQSIIDGNPYGTASTWGGAAVQSGSDGLNTHFIGHNPGIFNAVFSLGSGSQIIVTDGTGVPTTYTVSSMVRVDDYGAELSSGADMWDMITGSGGGERISLQACINDDTNLIAFAYN